MLKSISLIFLSLANAVAFRREKFNRVAIRILLYSSIVGYDSLAIISLGRGISIYGGLFHSTAITHSFDIFINLVSVLIGLIASNLRYLKIAESLDLKLVHYNIDKDKLKTSRQWKLKSSSNSFSLLLPHKVGCPKGSVSIKTYAKVDTKKLEINSLYIKLNPWFVTGFTDAEGCFLINVRPNPKMKSGYSVELVFKIGLHNKDSALVKNLRNFFGVGIVIAQGTDATQYWVGSIKDLQIIINHFDLYPLITQKRSDFELFKQVFYLIKQKDHLTHEGVKKIVSIKAVLNLGLKDNLKVAFPSIIPAIRPQFSLQNIPDPYWLSGFINGEGCFMVKIIKSSSQKVGYQVQLDFVITGHSRDEELINSLIPYLNCGILVKTKRGEVYFTTRKFSDITGIIIPFLKQYPMIGVKSEDYLDFCKVADLMAEKQHLTEEGLNLIRNIKAGMNSNRWDK